MLFLSGNASQQLYLWQVSDVHLHVAALTGPIQPFHVHIQRPGTQQDMSHWNYSGWQQHWDKLSSKVLPVTGYIEVKVANMRCIFREDDVTSELAWGEPEGKVWNVVELELGMNSAEVNQNCSWALKSLLKLFNWPKIHFRMHSLTLVVRISHFWVSNRSVPMCWFKSKTSVCLPAINLKIHGALCTYRKSALM